MKRYRTILVTAALGLLLLLLPACERENLLGTLSEGISFTVTTGAGSASDPARPAIKGGLSEDDFAAGTPAAVPLAGDLSTEEGATLSMTVDSRPMAFAPATAAPADSVPPTKAAPYGKGPLSADADLGLVAYTYSEANAAATAWTLYTAPAVTRFYNDKSRSDASSGKWIPAPESRLLWPKEGFIRFFAYAPYTDSNGDKIDDNVTVTTAGGAAPTLGYTVKPVASQIDLLVSDENSTAERIGDPGWRKIDVTMNMLHALTGIRFRIVDGLTIESVKVSGVYDKGDLALSTFPLSWSNLAKSSTTPEPEYELTDLSLGTGLKADADKPGYNVTEDDKTLLLMPQTVPAGAKITVTLSMKEGGTTVAGSERTIEADIATHQWLPGHLVTYTITHDGDVYVLHVQRNKGTAASPVYEDIDQLEFSYAGGLRPFYVTSYKISKEGSVMKYDGVDWKLQMKKNGAWVDVQSLSDIKDGNNNAWVYDMPVLGVHSHLSGQTGESAATSRIADTVTIAALPSEITPNAHTTTLRGFAAVGTKDNPVDLSLKSMPVGAETVLKTRSDIARSTANCYVVDRPGWYKIPMVYGNAIKDGAANPSAYQEAVAGNTRTGKVDHAGTQITEPWVSNKYAIDTVQLLWQDIPGLLTNVSATGSGKGERYIEFYVDPATIHQGNAVIAAYTSEGRESTDPDRVVAWSWHIWVTDADFSPVKVTNEENYVYGIMRQDIGAIDGIEKRDFDKARNGEFRLVQVENGIMVGKNKELKLVQKGIESDKDAYDSPDWSYPRYAMTYQWGRKDPFVLCGNTFEGGGRGVKPNEYVVTTNRGSGVRMYDKDGRIVDYFTPALLREKEVKNPSPGILNFYYNALIKDPLLLSIRTGGNIQYGIEKAGIETELNHWDNSGDVFYNGASTGSQAFRIPVPVKTVYDPSPLGWCVPPPGMVAGSNETKRTWWDLEVVDTNKNEGYLRLSNANGAIDFYPYFNPYVDPGSGSGSQQPRWSCCLYRLNYFSSSGTMLGSTYYATAFMIFTNYLVQGGGFYGDGFSRSDDLEPYHLYAIRPCQEVGNDPTAGDPFVGDGYVPDNTIWF